MGIELTEQLQLLAANIKVLRDRVLVKPIPYVHPVLATPGIEIQKGVVIATGYGRRERRKVEFRQEMPEGTQVIGPTGHAAKFARSGLVSGRSLFFEDGPETGRVLPMQVQPGDVVEFSFRNIEIVDFDRVAQFYPLQIGPLCFVWQSAIYSVDNNTDMEKICSESLLFQQSAGYDRNGNFMSGAEDWHRA